MLSKVKYLVIILLWIGSQAGLAATPESLLQALPKEISGFNRTGKIHLFEDSRWGASASYEKFLDGNKDNAVQLTVIVFDNKVEGIKPGLKSGIVRSAFKAALRDILDLERRKVYTKVKVLRSETRSYKMLEHKPIAAKFAVLNYSFKGNSGGEIPVQSFLLVTGIDGYILKIRMTALRNNENLEKQIHVVSRIIIARLLN